MKTLKIQLINEVEVILVRINVVDYRLVGATRQLEAGLSEKYWPDCNIYDPAEQENVTFSVDVTKELADKLVVQGKFSQVFREDYEAYDALMEYKLSNLRTAWRKIPDTFWACTLHGQELIDYYEAQYCVEGGRYYDRPIDFTEFENYQKGTGESGVCLVPTVVRKKDLPLSEKHN